ncbi:putative transaldolase [Candidatus Bilamarchaeum dharawalense]|uniref:Probable transaldolase n=1 Tax=Candidatus Bilamarchaeum dharawalense TaxID=2885759 RepID=A0A5E4LR82_9ARCH|nr:putative transaldolase [Candidatus Bilamarchaeum dharawalense]
MNFFLDTANLDSIKKAAELGMCDGITTNPTIIFKEGKDHKQVVMEIGKLVSGPISIESVGETAEQMVEDGKEFVKWVRNPVIKVPMTKEGLRAVRMFNKIGIKTNVTLIFSASQALLAAKAGASYVSPFVGRLDDIGQDGMVLVQDIVQIFKNYNFKTEVIVASVRSLKHVEDAAKAGAHIATIPPKIYEEMWKHALTDKGIEMFNADYKKSLEGKVKK